MASFVKIFVAAPLRLFCLLAVLCFQQSNAQVCTDPVNVVYGITNAGFIYPINVNTGVAGTAINPAYPGNAPDQSNGLGYNAVNGKFYYFKRIPSSTITEFVSFDPATNLYTLLSTPVTTNSVYSGSITADGTGYYCWDTQGTLFYYNIPANTWTTITSSLVDQYGKDVDSIIRLHASGDGALDGNGNLWILPSSNTMFGLFRLSFPLPTTAKPSVTVQEIVPMAPPPAKFVGIAFNVSGEIFMCTSTDQLYRLEDNLTLTHMSTLSLNMGDLTSCNFPIAILALSDLQLSTRLNSGKVQLTWKPITNSINYSIQRSIDGVTWTTIATQTSNSSSTRMTFDDESPRTGKNYYRIRVTVGTTNMYSAIRLVDLSSNDASVIWPNPVINKLFIQSHNKGASVTLMDATGRRIRNEKFENGFALLDFSPLPAGKYIVTVKDLSGTSTSHKIIKK